MLKRSDTVHHYYLFDYKGYIKWETVPFDHFTLTCILIKWTFWREALHMSNWWNDCVQLFTILIKMIIIIIIYWEGSLPFIYSFIPPFLMWFGLSFSDTNTVQYLNLLILVISLLNSLVNYAPFIVPHCCSPYYVSLSILIRELMLMGYWIYGQWPMDKMSISCD